MSCNIYSSQKKYLRIFIDSLFGFQGTITANNSVRLARFIKSFGFYFITDTLRVSSRIIPASQHRTQASMLFVRAYPSHDSLRYLRGDEGIRTLDPLLSRQVLSQLSYTPKIRHPPALPCRLQHSTIGRSGLNHRVRDENGCDP